MKDESKGKMYSKSKMYSLMDVDDEEVKKVKGVNENVVKEIRHKEYIGALFNKKIIRHKMKIIQNWNS